MYRRPLFFAPFRKRPSVPIARGQNLPKQASTACRQVAGYLPLPGTWFYSPLAIDPRRIQPLF